MIVDGEMCAGKVALESTRRREVESLIMIHPYIKRVLCLSFVNALIIAKAALRGRGAQPDCDPN